jgi:acetyl-CoA synthetase
LAGDGACCNLDNGYFRITGRIGIVLNVSGHRMGTMEFSRRWWRTARWWPRRRDRQPDDLTGEAIVAFVLKRARRRVMKLIARVARLGGQTDGPIAKPKDIRLATTCLPKTRERIMRRLLARHAKAGVRRTLRWKTRRSWTSCRNL